MLDIERMPGNSERQDIIIIIIIIIIQVLVVYTYTVTVAALRHRHGLDRTLFAPAQPCQCSKPNYTRVWSSCLRLSFVMGSSLMLLFIFFLRHSCSKPKLGWLDDEKKKSAFPRIQAPGLREAATKPCPDEIICTSFNFLGSRLGSLRARRARRGVHHPYDDETCMMHDG